MDLVCSMISLSLSLSILCLYFEAERWRTKRHEAVELLLQDRYRCSVLAELRLALNINIYNELMVNKSFSNILDLASDF